MTSGDLLDRVDRVEVHIAHGDLEDAGQEAAMAAVRAAATPFWLRTVATNDTTTLVVVPAGMRPVLDAIAAHRESWWRVQLTGPPWR